MSIAAILIAIEQGLVDAPTLSARLPQWMKSRRWRYMPAICVVLAALIFSWDVSNPVVSNTVSKNPTERVVYVPKEVPGEDPKQGEEIARLKRMLSAARAPAPNASHPAAASSYSAPPQVASAPVAPALKPEDQDLLDSLKCEKATKAEIEELKGFIRMAGFYQNFGKSSKTEKMMRPTNTETG